MTGPCYRADPAAARIVADLEDMLLLFHRPSGITHVLGSPAREILAALDVEPGDAATILDRLAATRGIAAEDDAIAVVAARLAELEAAGLAARM